MGNRAGIERPPDTQDRTIWDVIVIGAGPAGASAAATLASSGLSVLLLEEKRMPRDKLCGEFIAAEALPVLERIGATRAILDAGASHISSYSLIASGGRALKGNLTDISSGPGIGLSRVRFDTILFDCARKAGARCMEGIAVRSAAYRDPAAASVEGIRVPEGTAVSFSSGMVIDASGRNSRMMYDKPGRRRGLPGSRLYARKVHLTRVSGPADAIEIFFFPGGYGGLSPVEDGLFNLCFIASEREIARYSADPRELIEKTIMRNPAAARRLREAVPAGDWLAAGPLAFGTHRLNAGGIIAAGDAAGMIDPFTGTGMQMALRTGEMAARAVIEVIGSPDEYRKAGPRPSLLESVISRYRNAYDREFRKRLKAAALLRRAAFSPGVAAFLGEVFAHFPALARPLLRATRSCGS